jgi:hypothetical protein
MTTNHQHMFCPLTVAEWDQLTSMIERAGLACSDLGRQAATFEPDGPAYTQMADELTAVHGELVNGWQAEFYAADGDPCRPAGSDPAAPVLLVNAPKPTSAKDSALVLVALFNASLDPELNAAVDWSVWEGRAAAVLEVLADQVAAYQQSAEPGAFPVMGDPWPAGSGPAVPPRCSTPALHATGRCACVTWTWSPR